MYGIRRRAPKTEWWFSIPNEGITFINIIPDGGFSSTGPTGNANTVYNGWTMMEREVRAIMGGAREGYKPIWATEYGFPTGGTSAGEQTSEANTGEGIRRAAHMARALGNLPVISYHTAYDYLGSESGGASNELYYGIGAVGLTDKPEPAAAMRYATRMLP